jgi:predicted DsbA family dithiol-disulfide isomerase
MSSREIPPFVARAGGGAAGAGGHRRALRHAYEEAGVTGVPMFVIGDKVLTGLQDRETLEAVIEEELARQTPRR